MIVREIVLEPDKVLENFDYFNDYDDTKNWLIYTNAQSYVDHDELLKRLNDGFNEWLYNFQTGLSNNIG